jgi:hypothetical protein
MNFAGKFRLENDPILFLVDRSTVKQENVLHPDGLLIHAGNLGDSDDLAGAVGRAVLARSPERSRT